ncbi:hypothetical protein ACHAXS_004563 [Conticribra weissflogii]
MMAHPPPEAWPRECAVETASMSSDEIDRLGFADDPATTIHDTIRGRVPIRGNDGGADSDANDHDRDGTHRSTPPISHCPSSPRLRRHHRPMVPTSPPRPRGAPDDDGGTTANPSPEDRLSASPPPATTSHRRQPLRRHFALSPRQKFQRRRWLLRDASSPSSSSSSSSSKLLRHLRPSPLGRFHSAQTTGLVTLFVLAAATNAWWWNLPREDERGDVSRSSWETTGRTDEPGWLPGDGHIRKETAADRWHESRHRRRRHSHRRNDGETVRGEHDAMEFDDKWPSGEQKEWRPRRKFHFVYSSRRNSVSEWTLESFWTAGGASASAEDELDSNGKRASNAFRRMVSLEGQWGSGPSVDGVDLPDWIVFGNESSANESSGDESDLKSSTVVWEKGRDCVPMADWMDTFHPTCNSIHEMDVSLMLSEQSYSLVSSKGFWRNAWKVNVTNTEEYPMTNSKLRQMEGTSVGDRYAVLKSLKYVHDPNDETFELSRVDAVALDVVTQSRFTINIYGYCGTSSLQEFANGDLKGLLPTLEPMEKLRYAAWVAQGVSDVHGVDVHVDVDEDEENRRSRGSNRTDAEKVVPFIHNDLNMDNILLGTRDGVEVPLLNDFNIAVFRKKDARTGEPCKFRGRFANPQWMSPEQQERPEDDLSTRYLNEKVDIYALGNILYKIAVGNSPWKNDYKTDKITPELKAKIARAKLRGGKPKVPADVRNTTDPSVLAILNAMDWCYRNDPELRPSAREIAYNLKAELEALERNSTLVQLQRLRSRLI